MGMLGAAGSREHAELYLKFLAAHYAPPVAGAGLPDGELPTPAGAGTIINLLCPRPEVPQGAVPASAGPVRLPPPDRPADGGVVPQLYAQVDFRRIARRHPLEGCVFAWQHSPWGGNCEAPTKPVADNHHRRTLWRPLLTYPLATQRPV
jgi:hypothetical protein